jgi:hypothetical protein
MKQYQITISRFSGDSEVSKENWKDLISALVLAGYEIYGDDDKIVYKLGNDDILEEVEE